MVTDKYGFAWPRNSLFEICKLSSDNIPFGRGGVERGTGERGENAPKNQRAKAGRSVETRISIMMVSVFSDRNFELNKTNECG
jgi:hypothetical protein